MASTVTVTGKIGTATTVTSLVLSNVTQFTVDTDKNILTVVHDAIITAFEVASATTVTSTKSGTTWTLVVS
jgi:hypothetical protein